MARACIDPVWMRVALGFAGPTWALQFCLPVLHSLGAAEALLTLSKNGGADWRIEELTTEWFRHTGSQDNGSGAARVEALGPDKATFTIEGSGTDGNSYLGTATFLAKVTKARAATGLDAPLFAVTQAPESIELGATATAILQFKEPANLKVTTPYGHGLRVADCGPYLVEAGRHTLRVTADRTHEVNLGKPWLLIIQAESGLIHQTTELYIEVPDRMPGRTFYILTEDCETFDGGAQTGNYGDAAAFGNHNNFMDPEDYLIQMVAKPNRMNEIADRHGAHWTHFWAAHQRFAAEWAATQSTSNRWAEILRALDVSVREGSARHEYAPHLHCDYEPDSKLPPQPRLTYDPDTDGILPNDYYDPVSNPTHRHHDWDGAARGGPGIKQPGAWNDVDSKTGSLFKALRHLCAVQVSGRQVLCARTGSFDFGATPDDQLISTQAYEELGLLANSDARFGDGTPIAGGALILV